MVSAVSTRSSASSPRYARAPSMNKVRAGEDILARGDKGASVADLQSKLNARGAQLQVDGKFGPKTEAAVQRFQQENKLKVDGKVGTETLPHLEATARQGPAPVERARADAKTQTAARQGAARQGQEAKQRVEKAASTPPSSASEAQRYDHYKQLIESRGGTFRDGPGQKNIVGLRTETSTKTSKNGKYDDKFVMLWKDKAGNKKVSEYRGNMDPSGRYDGRVGKDANGDGRKDLGRLPEGSYDYTMGKRYARHARGAPALRPTQAAVVERDSNHNGKFGDDRHRTTTANDMLFHKGGVGRTNSAGCQTLPPAEWSRFWKDLSRDGRPGKINYTVVNR